MLLKYYQQFSEDKVWDELPMEQGYAYIVVAMENDAWLQFGGVKATGKTYIAMETDRLFEIAKLAWESK